MKSSKISLIGLFYELKLRKVTKQVFEDKITQVSTYGHYASQNILIAPVVLLVSFALFEHYSKYTFKSI